MQRRIERLIREAIERCNQDGIPFRFEDSISVFQPVRDELGDWTTNLPFILSRSVDASPLEIAKAITERIIDTENILKKVEIAPPGFINFYLTEETWHSILREISIRGEEYGNSDHGRGKRVNIEFVSANPTGPLHIGHGRGAVVGTVLSNILSVCGYQVVREYYINDTGNQVENLGESVYKSAIEMLGFDSKGLTRHYEGDYIASIAERWIREGNGGYFENKKEGIMKAGEFAVRLLLEGIKRDLEDFGVTFDVWTSERELYERGIVDEALSLLEKKELVYKKDNAVWFKSSTFEDEKDRVLVREDGRPTYLASDVGYHIDKIKRGFDIIIDIWGADHHGYIPRMKAVMESFLTPEKMFKTILVQLVNLTRNGVLVPMGKRSGEFISLRSIFEEVGVDAAKFFYLMRSSDSHLDFDLELAKKESNENPVYLSQYAHARICGLLREAEKRGIRIPDDFSGIDLSPLREEAEIRIIKHLSRFPDTLLRAATQYEPHLLTFYIIELSKKFNSYYNIGGKRYRILSDDVHLTEARLALVMAVKTVLCKGLKLLSVSAPMTM